MLLQALNEVKELDNQITSLHGRLQDLYQKRAQLIDPATTARPSEESTTRNKQWDPLRDIYDKAVIAWKQYDLTLPAYGTVKSKLKKAYELSLQLQQADDTLIDKLYPLLIPPTKQLKTTLATPENADLLNFTSRELFMAARPTRGWTVTLVFAPELRQQIVGLAQYEQNREYRYKNHDCRGLGVHELIAATLIGIQLLANDGWAVLLKDDGLDRAVCARLTESAIFIDEEDSDCLIGDNYLYPAIRVA